MITAPEIQLHSSKIEAKLVESNMHDYTLNIHLIYKRSISYQNFFMQIG